MDVKSFIKSSNKVGSRFLDLRFIETFSPVFSSIYTASVSSRVLSAKGRDLPIDQRVHGFGSATCKKLAIVKAVSELLEREAAVCFKPDSVTFRVANGTGIEKTFFDNSVFPNRESIKKPIAADVLSTPARWVSAKSLFDGKVVSVPYLLTTIHREIRPDEYIFSQSSSGIAAHFDTRKALLNALYEIIERDSVGKFLAGKSNASKITYPRVLKTEAAGIYSCFRALVNTSIDCFQVDSEVACNVVVSLLGVRTKGKIKIIVGSAAHSNISIALHKSLLELVGQYKLIDAQETKRESIRLHDENLLNYFQQNSNFTKSLDKNNKCSTSLSKIFIELRRKYSDVYWLRLDCQDTNNRRTKVVRVVVPGVLRIPSFLGKPL